MNLIWRTPKNISKQGSDIGVAQRHIQDLVEHLRLSFLAKIVTGFQLHRRFLVGFWWICFCSEWLMIRLVNLHLVLYTVNIRGHPLSTYAKFSEKLTFLTPWYAHVRVRIRGLEMLVSWKILRTYLMDGPLKELRNCILCIIRVQSLICSIRVCVSLHFVPILLEN